MVDIADRQEKAAAAQEAALAERKPLPRWMITLTSIAAVLILWEIFGRRINPVFGSYPSAIAVAFWELAVSGQLWSALYESLRPFLLGYALAIVIGVPLGLLIGRYRVARDLLLPACEVLRPIPAIAWVPMSIMLWPNNEASIVFITFIGAFFPILLNTIHGVTALDSILLRAAHCLGANEAKLFWNVILPGALPQIFTGLAVGMGVAWVSLIAAEMISGQFGVGYFTWEAYSLVSYAEIALGMITIGVLGLLCSGAIRLAGHLAMPWLAYSAAGRR